LVSQVPVGSVLELKVIDIIEPDERSASECEYLIECRFLPVSSWACDSVREWHLRRSYEQFLHLDHSVRAHELFDSFFRKSLPTLPAITARVRSNHRNGLQTSLSLSELQRQFRLISERDSFDEYLGALSSLSNAATSLEVCLDNEERGRALLHVFRCTYQFIDFVRFHAARESPAEGGLGTDISFRLTYLYRS
jgi:hypothetical protein